MFRKEISREQRESSINAVPADIADGVREPTQAPLDDVTREAERISALHSEKLGTRSLDILHVATALALGAQDFLSFDQRQIRLARRAGLKAPRL